MHFSLKLRMRAIFSDPFDGEILNQVPFGAMRYSNVFLVEAENGNDLYYAPSSCIIVSIACHKALVRSYDPFDG